MTIAVYYGHKTIRHNKHHISLIMTVFFFFPSEKVSQSLIAIGELGLDFVDLLFYVNGKHLRSCRDSQLT